MRLAGLLFCLLFLCCCRYTVIEDRPYIEHKTIYQIKDWQAQQNKSIYSAEEVGRYFSSFITKWESHGLPGTRALIGPSFDQIELHWQPTRFVNPEDPDQTKLRGLTFIRKNKITIFVYDCSQESNPKLGKTALGHELIHVALYATTRRLEHDHFSVPGKEWPIRYLDFQEELNGDYD